MPEGGAGPVGFDGDDLFEHHPQPMWVSEADGSRFVAVNRAACAALGYSREEFLSGAPGLAGLAGAGAGRHEHRRPNGDVVAVDLVQRPIRFAGRPSILVMVEDVTAREAGRSALDLAERLARTAARMARVGGWMLDPVSGRVEMSEEVCAIHGLEPGSTPDLARAIDFYAPEYRDRIRAAVERCVRDAEPYDLELELLPAGGGRLWVRAIGEAVCDAAGAVIHIQGAFQDISERKQQENELLQNRRRLQQFADVMPQIIWTMDPEGRVEYANRAYYEFVGRPQGEAPGSGWLESVHPEDLPRALGTWQEVSLSGRDYAVELRLRGAAGCYRWFLSTARAARDDSGRIAGWFGSTTDIHEAKLAEESLRRSEARLRAIFDSEPECVKVVSRDGRLLEINPAGLAMMEVTEAAAVLGQPIADAIHPDDRTAYQSLHDRAIGGERGHAQFRIRSFMGNERWMESHASPMHEADGSIGSVLSITRDITDRRLVEQAQRQHAAESRVLELISSGAALPRILDEVVRIVETMQPKAIGSVVLLDPDGRRLRHGAGANLPDAYNRAIDGLPIGPAAGSCGTAMYLRRQVIVSDIEADPLWTDYRDLARQFGLKACWSTPIIAGTGEVLASFALYYREPRSPDEADQGIIDRAVHLARVALERTRETRALRESEERFRQLAENIEEVFWLVDEATNRFLYVSPAYEAVWGRPVDELYLDPARWMEAVHPDDLAKVKAAVLRRAAGGYNLEYRITRPDGGLRWVADRGFPVRDPEGVVVRIVGSARDVTRRKETEQRLLESEERFQAMARAIADVLWDWDLAADRIWWSESFQTVFGYAPDELEPGPESWIRRIHPEDRDRVVAGIRKAIAEQRPQWSDEYRFLHRDGRTLRVEDRGRLILAADGRALRLVGGMRDVTVVRAAEERIKDLSQRLETLVREAKIGILVHQDFKPVLANGELARLLGYPGPEAILALSDIRDLFAPEERERITDYNTQRRSGSSEAPGFYAVKGFRRDGSIVTMENRAFPIVWGGEMSVCAMLVDVTGRIELEERLRQAQRLEAVGQLTGGVAHDFNNLLTVILGNAELLAESLPGDGALKTLAETTRKAAERGADLTNRLLAFSRRQALDPKPVDIGKLMTGMDALLRRTLGEHVEIEMVRGGGLWRAFVDMPQLENAVLNLCINARDAMPEGGRLTIEMANVHLDQNYADWNEEVTPGQYVLIAISDTGSGMSADVMARAFEPFFTTKDVGKGSGLGLSMVFGFAKQSNGHVKIYSEPGHGTTVRLYLPRARGEEAGGEVPAVASVGGGAEKILLVEDDDLVREHVAGQLQSLGYRVVAVSNGPAALERLRIDADFDLLFTDVVMPGGLSGRQLADAARPIRPNLPVLFTSGYTENAVVHHGRLDPGVHLLNKPYRRQELARKVRQVLGKPEE